MAEEPAEHKLAMLAGPRLQCKSVTIPLGGAIVAEHVAITTCHRAGGAHRYFRKTSQIRLDQLECPSNARDAQQLRSSATTWLEIVPDGWSSGERGRIIPQRNRCVLPGQRTLVPLQLAELLRPQPSFSPWSDFSEGEPALLCRGDGMS